MSLTLRKIQKSDLHYFLKWWKDAELIQLTSGVYEESDKVLVGYFATMRKSTKDRHYIIVYNAKAIGHIAIIHKTSRTFELQVVIGEKQHWGKGLGSQAIARVLKIAFTKFGYTKGVVEVRPENVRAIRAYKSCGFVQQGIIAYTVPKPARCVGRLHLQNHEHRSVQFFCTPWHKADHARKSL